MRKPLIALVTLSLLTAGVAQAQMTGGGGGGHRGGGNGGAAPAANAPARATPVDQLDIIGVVKQIGPEPDRVTISYNAVEGLSWPAGEKPFVVAKSDLLKGVTVGQRVRFRLESQQISMLTPF
jgi:Cu(I)/Ag(I) efflux system protein CusF